MQIIDSHVHFWDPQHLTYEWLNGAPEIRRPFLPNDYNRATEGIEIVGLVFVQADCLPEEGLAEVDWVAGLDAPLRAMVAFAPLELGDAVRPHLEQLKLRPLVTAVRRLIQSEGAGFAVQPDFVRGVQMLADYDFRFDICIRHHQLPEAIELVKQCPAIAFVLDHIGKPDIAGGEMYTWRSNMKKLAGFPNVACKLSGVITEADPEAWTVESLRPYIDHALNVFGIDRVMFGSDWPVVNLAGSYGRWFDALVQITDDLTSDDKRKLFSENTLKFYSSDNAN